MNLNTLKEAEGRIPNQRERILNLLRSAGEKGVTNNQLIKLCVRWNSRMHELYQEGYEIKTELVADGVYKYILLKEPEVKRGKPVSAVKLLQKEIEKNYKGTVTAEHLELLLDKLGLNVVRRAGTHKIITQ